MRGDIISRRAQGARTNRRGVSPTMRVAIVAASYGRKVPHTTGLLGYNSLEVEGTEIFRGMVKITADPNVKPDVVYYPGLHFVLRYVDQNGYIIDPNSPTVFDPTEIYIDWRSAPYLSAPQISGLEEVQSGGDFTAGTYTVGVEYVDGQGKRTKMVSQQIELLNDNSAIRLNLVPEKYAWKFRIWIMGDGMTDPTSWYVAEIDPYGVYDSNPTGWGDPANGYSEGDISIVSVMIRKKSLFSEATEDPNEKNEARAIPDNPATSSYNIEATILIMDTSHLDTPTEYFSLEDVAADHGKESEVYNIADKMFQNGIQSVVVSAVPAIKALAPGGEVGMEIVPPDLTDYYDAVDRLDAEDIMFFGTTYPGTDILTYGLSKAEELSDKVEGQKERYFLFALPGGWSVSDLESVLTITHSSNSVGKRAVIGVVDGGEARVDTWNTLSGTETDTKVLSVVDNVDITPMVLLFAAIAKYASTGDPANPLTNKYIYGFRLPGRKNPVLLKRYTEKGAMFFTADSEYSPPYVDTAVLPSIILSIEDGEMSIAVTEDILDIQIRQMLRNFRGKKALPTRLLAIRDRLRQLLNQFVANGWIEEYNESSVKVWMDENNPTRVRGSFSYRPVYPINQLWVEHTFIVNV